jgi:feruloyl esterase
MPDPGPSWKLSDFNWDRDSKRLGMTETLYGAPNPDLRPFKATGAKFILYQGWLDRMVMPSQAVDYYEAVERQMGGEANTQDFFRLFMVPDMDHCLGGPGADTIDYLSALEAWVERGEAPDKLLAVKAKPDPAMPDWRRPLPVPESDVQFSRPVFPYPVQTRYKSGDPDKSSSYVGVRRK